MAEKITFEPVQVALVGQNEGRLVYVDGRLVAVLARLDHTQAEMQGLWYAEAAFNGLERMKEETFATLEAAEDWIRKQLAK